MERWFHFQPISAPVEISPYYHPGYRAMCQNYASYYYYGGHMVSNDSHFWNDIDNRLPLRCEEYRMFSMI